jgi:endonuclease-8
MPEGPSIVILREQAAGFAGRTIAHASGNSKQVDFAALEGQPIVALRSWGKHFLIQLPDRALRVHLLMFGSYRINERKEDAQPRLSLGFDDGEEFNFYSCSVKTLPPDLDAQYDWSADVMSDQWDARAALKKLRELVAQMRVYAFDFLRWKKAFVLKQHWLAHTKRICPRCDIPFHKDHLGKTRRRSFFCVKCQKQYPPALTPARSGSTRQSQRTPPAS